MNHSQLSSFTKILNMFYASIDIILLRVLTRKRFLLVIIDKFCFRKVSETDHDHFIVLQRIIVSTVCCNTLIVYV